VGDPPRRPTRARAGGLDARRGDPDLDPLCALGLEDVGRGDRRDHLLASGLDAVRCTSGRR